MLEAVALSKTQTLGRLITALGIRGIGEIAAEDLSKHYIDLDALSKANSEELQEIEGFGPNMAEALIDWFVNPKNRKIIRKFKSAGVWPQQTENISNFPQTLTGMKFVVTGSLKAFTRTTIKTYISSRGGKVSDSVSKKTTYLVAGENPGSKKDKAESLGVRIITEDELIILAEKKI